MEDSGVTGDDIVIRAGTVRDVSKVSARIEKAIDRAGIAVLSVHSRRRLAQEDDSTALLKLCEESGVPHRQVQCSTVARLAARGFRLSPERADGEPETHYHVHFASPVAQSQIQDFIDCFDEAVANPAGGKRERA